MHVRNAAFVTFALLLAFAVSGCTSSEQAAPSPTTSTNVSPDATAPAAPSAAGSAQLGAQIFTTGNGADGSPIAVSAGSGGACSRCHGADAKGAAGPDIRWDVLTGTIDSPRAPRFTLADEAAFATAVTTGEAGGKQLGPMMPRFKLTPEQVSALVAHLKTL